MNIYSIEEKYQADTASAEKWLSETYKRIFGTYFEQSDKLYDAIHTGNVSNFSDEDLSNILSVIPLDLLVAAEALSSVKVRTAFFKQQLKEYKHDSRDATDISELELLIHCYTALEELVSTKMSFSRELIMTAKKLWDARQEGANAMPVAERDYSNLPEYPATYIK